MQCVFSCDCKFRVVGHYRCRDARRTRNCRCMPIFTRWRRRLIYKMQQCVSLCSLANHWVLLAFSEVCKQISHLQQSFVAINPKDCRKNCTFKFLPQCYVSEVYPWTCVHFHLSIASQCSVIIAKDVIMQTMLYDSMDAKMCWWNSTGVTPPPPSPQCGSIRTCMSDGNHIIFDDLEWPSRSFTCCKLSQIQFLNSCAADWQCLCVT